MGEIGTLERFTSEAGLAVYMGMAALNNSSGKKKSVKTPRLDSNGGGGAALRMRSAVAHLLP